jgi:centractin
MKNGQVIESKMQKQSITKAKELYCYISQNYNEELKEFYNNSNEETKEWELPDKRRIKIGTERFEATEILFEPKKYGYDYIDFQELFKQTVKSIDSDLRESMLANIIFNGGGHRQKFKNNCY